MRQQNVETHLWVPKDCSWESRSKPNGDYLGDSYRPGAEPNLKCWKKKQQGNESKWAECIKKNHPFYSTSKEFLQKGKVEKNKTIYLVAKWWILCDWNPGWGCQMIPPFFFWFVQKTDIQSWWVGVRFPPKKEVRVDFSIFSPRFLKRSSFWDTFACCFNRAFWVLQIWCFSHPENHESVEPRTLVHLENDIILILLAWEVWKLLRGARCWVIRTVS